MSATPNPLLQPSETEREGLEKAIEDILALQAANGKRYVPIGGVRALEHKRKVKQIVDLCLERIQAAQTLAVDKALLDTGLFVRCDYCDKVHDAGKSRHYYDENAKPLGHICDDCAHTAPLNPNGEKNE